jgi:hypothetical protein
MGSPTAPFSMVPDRRKSGDGRIARTGNAAMKAGG